MNKNPLPRIFRTAFLSASDTLPDFFLFQLSQIAEAICGVGTDSLISTKVISLSLALKTVSYSPFTVL